MGWKWDIPEKKQHLTIHQQNLAGGTCNQSKDQTQSNEKPNELEEYTAVWTTWLSWVGAVK